MYDQCIIVLYVVDVLDAVVCCYCCRLSSNVASVTLCFVYVVAVIVYYYNLFLSSYVFPALLGVVCLVARFDFSNDDGGDDVGVRVMMALALMMMALIMMVMMMRW